jgi:hypothetical protein
MIAVKKRCHHSFIHTLNNNQRAVRRTPRKCPAVYFTKPVYLRVIIVEAMPSDASPPECFSFHQFHVSYSTAILVRLEVVTQGAQVIGESGGFI